MKRRLNSVKPKIRYVELLKGKTGWYWHIKAENGRVLAHSEIYEKKSSAEKIARTMNDHSYSFLDKTL